eukprot:759139-Hanusia_phi.AAC.2
METPTHPRFSYITRGGGRGSEESRRGRLLAESLRLGSEGTGKGDPNENLAEKGLGVQHWEILVDTAVRAGALREGAGGRRGKGTGVGAKEEEVAENFSRQERQDKHAQKQGDSPVGAGNND